jgi:hypothetical protein
MTYKMGERRIDFWWSADTLVRVGFLHFRLETQMTSATSCAMSKLPRDTIAMRREILVALVAFVVGFVGVLATLARVIVRFVTPEARWWDVLHTSINAILISVVFGGLGSAVLASWLLSRYHYRRGFYRCRFCHRPLKRPGCVCDCAEAQAVRMILYEDDAA